MSQSRGAADSDELEIGRAQHRSEWRGVRILALTGGGYRGLFTAAVLDRLESSMQGRKIADTFDVFAGTSIGGLIACALATGVSAAAIRAAIQESGEKVFPPKLASTVRRIAGTPLYDAKALQQAVRGCLATAADMPIGNIEKGLVVTSISTVTGAPVLYRSSWFGTHAYQGTLLGDACMASSAAPTYFRAHHSGPDQGPMVDGGLVANSPDLLALLEVLATRPTALPTIEMLSVGTAGVGSGGMAGDVPATGLGWALKAVPFMIAAQERLAITQAGALLPGRYLRINHEPEPGQRALSEMSTVDSSMTGTLTALAEHAVKVTLQRDATLLARILR